MASVSQKRVVATLVATLGACMACLLSASPLSARLTAQTMRYGRLSDSTTFSRLNSRATIYRLDNGGDTGLTHSFYLNGYHSLSFRTDSDYTLGNETLVGVLPAMYTSQHDRALVVGAGTGLTASGAAQVFGDVTVVDLDPNARDLLTHFGPENDHVLSRPNVTLTMDDALTWLTHSKQRFNAIVATPTVPSYSGANRAYTLAFMEAVERHLTPEGVYTLWFDRRFSDDAFAILRATASRVFDHIEFVALQSGYFEIICSNAPIGVRAAPGQIDIDDPINGYIAAHTNTDTADWAALAQFIKDRRKTAPAMPKSTSINTLNAPILQYKTVIRSHRGFVGGTFFQNQHKESSREP